MSDGGHLLIEDAAFGGKEVESHMSEMCARTLYVSVISLTICLLVAPTLYKYLTKPGGLFIVSLLARFPGELPYSKGIGG